MFSTWILEPSSAACRMCSSLPNRILVDAAEDGLRLDRWLKARYPNVSFGEITKLCKKGQFRVDGCRTKAQHRVLKGQEIRVPPFDMFRVTQKAVKSLPEATTSLDMKKLVLYHDEDIIALNKPPKVAVHGGTHIFDHIEAGLGSLKLGYSRPPLLVHRLDRDTSGILLLARSASVAKSLTEMFASHTIEKLYWAAVAGRPGGDIEQGGFGLLDAPLSSIKLNPGFERVDVDWKNGKPAQTCLRLIASTSVDVIDGMTLSKRKEARRSAFRAKRDMEKRGGGKVAVNPGQQNPSAESPGDSTLVWLPLLLTYNF